MLHIFKNAKSFLIEREEFLKLSTVLQEAAAVDRHVQVFVQEWDYRAAGFFEGIIERAYHGVVTKVGRVEDTRSVSKSVFSFWWMKWEFGSRRSVTLFQ